MSAATPDVSSADRSTYLFFNAQEALLIEAACERLIPEDELGAGALTAGVPNYLDKQLGGAWGAGERLYRSGPWQFGTRLRKAISCLTRRRSCSARAEPMPITTKRSIGMA